jgi:predicted TIM-barrel fold metal-dependent hydrolase
MSHTWIDTHIHVSDIGPDGTRRGRMLEDLLDVLDRCDADLRFIISCDGPYFSRMVDDPAQILEANRMIHDLASRAPGRLYGSCMVNPHFLEASLEAMDVCLGEWGFVQLGEMLQYMMDYQMDSDPVETLVRKAVEYDAPVQVHLGTYWHKDHEGSVDGMDHLRDLLRAAERVPEAKYVLAHAIGCGPSPDYVPWADMFLDVLAGVFDEHPDNFWIEVRDFQSPALKRTLDQTPPTHLLSGTDWTTRVGPPFQSYGTMFGEDEDANPFPPKVASFVRFLRDAGASEDDVLRIGAHNARSLYKLDAR